MMTSVRMKAGFGNALALTLLAFVAASCFASADTARVEGASIRTLEPSTAVKLRFLNPLEQSHSVSPDEALVAYSVCDPIAEPGMQNMFESCEMWVQEVAGGKARQITRNSGGSVSPSWSPDGRWLAFYSRRSGKHQVWLWDRSTSELKRVSDAQVFTDEGLWLRVAPGWSADSSKIVVRLEPTLAAVKSRTAPQDHADREGIPTWARPSVGIEVDVQYASGSNNGELHESQREKPKAYSSYWPLVDLASIDVATGRATYIANGLAVGAFWISPDGKRVAFTANTSSRPIPNNGSYAWALYSAGMDGTNSRIIAPRLEQWWADAVSWSPNGEYLAYLTGPVEAHGKPTNCVVVASNGSGQRVLKGPTDVDSRGHRGPRWDTTGRYILIRGDTALWRGDAMAGEELQRVSSPSGYRMGSALSTTANWAERTDPSLYIGIKHTRTERPALLKVDAVAGTSKIVHEGELEYGNELAPPIRLAGDNQLIFFGGSARHSQELWSLDLTTSSSHAVTRINPQVDPKSLAPAQVIEYLDHDGETLRAALMLPAGYEPGKRYPTLLWVYAGSNGSGAVNKFGLSGNALDNMHILSTRGYAILAPDIPTGTGTVAQDIIKAVMPAIDKAIALGVADPKRLAVYGASNGGYSTMVLVAHSKRFKAAIASIGFADLGSLYREPIAHNIIENYGHRMEGPPWEQPYRYLANSPLYSLDRVQTPVLIQAGGMDSRTPLYLSEQIFYALKRQNKEAVLLNYRNEGHGNVKPENIVDFWERRIAFLDEKVCGGRCLPASTEQGA